MEGNERKAECKKHIEGLRLRTHPQNGITLIALIITIIVMLILVGVTINVVLNGGLFTQAQEAAKNTQKEAEREQLLSALVAAIGTDGKVDFSKLVLPKGWTGSNGTYISPEGNVYNVDKKGNITDGTDEGNNVVYEYTLAEIIGKAQNSSTAMYMDEKEANEDYVEGEPYGLMAIIPFSEFWKEGTPDNIKNGKETTSKNFAYEYIVTVENFSYIEIEDEFSMDSDTRGLIFVGLTPEQANNMSGIKTTENCIMIYALGLTAEDNLEQIKIKIQEPEPEPEFNSFTLGDLVDASTVTVKDSNTGYFDISLSDFNNIIGQDIKSLDGYLCAEALFEYKDSDNNRAYTDLDDGNLIAECFIRMTSASSSNVVYDYGNVFLVNGCTRKMGITLAELRKDEYIDWCITNGETEADGAIMLAVLKNSNSRRRGSTFINFGHGYWRWCYVYCKK